MTDIVSRLSASLAERYRIERELGQGGMATVYLAQDVRHQRRVALKVLRPELAAILGAERFLHEIRTTANLQHPHILPLHDSGEVEGTVFYVMPFVDGESLRDRLNREKQLPLEDAVRIAREIADALEYAHAQGVVHRDIKPENILLHGGHAMVADFGIALAVSTVGGGTRMTETGMSLGTPHYMAPEQAMGDREITPRADIYALGCVLYEMLTGDPPFTGSTAQAIVARVVTESPRSLTAQRHTIPPHVEATALKALEKLPADRFAGARDFAEALQNPALTASLRSPVPGHRSSAVDWRSRYFMPAMAAALVFAVAGGWGWMHESPARDSGAVIRYAVAEARHGAVRPGQLAMSADGRILVYHGFDSLRLQRLFIRYADRETPVEVRISGAGSNPFLSPDNRQLGLLLDGRLVWVPLEGGVATTITDLPDGGYGGAAWGPDSSVVFSSQGSLYRIRVDGSGRELLLARDTANFKRYGMPAFTRDGRSIVFSVADQAGSANEPRVGVLSLRNRQFRVLDVEGRNPRLANGHLLYGDAAGGIHAVPFDERRLSPVGASVPIIERAAVVGITTLYAASQSGAVAYIGGGAEEGRDLVTVDRQGRVQILPLPGLAWRHPRFSPDGRRLVVGNEFRGSRGDLWVYDFTSRRLQRVTFDSTNVHPVWSPDGQQILFAALRGTRNALFRVRSDGSTRPESVLARPHSIWEAEFAPGGVLLFREDHGSNNRDIFMLRNDSVIDLLTSPLDERTITISPDGQWFAFVSNASGNNAVYLRRLAGTSGQWPVSAGPGLEPRWGRGGSELLYRNGDTLFTVPVRLGATPVIGQPQSVTVGRYLGSIYHAYYDVSPDGQSFVFVRSRGEAGSISVHVALNLIQPAR